MGALHSAVQQGKALYVGISSYGPERTRRAASILRDLGTPLLIHQPSYSMFNRWVEHGLLDVLDEIGVGMIAFSALVQGLLTGRYLNGVPNDSRAAGTDATLPRSLLTEQRLDVIRKLNGIAEDRGQSLAQLAVSWVLHDARVTSVVVGASSVAQLEDTVAAVDETDFEAAHLATIDDIAKDDPAIDLWRAQSQIGV
jgi:L-glyceraldehyde 3-phosphate reductase